MSPNSTMEKKMGDLMNADVTNISDIEYQQPRNCVPLD